MVLGMICDAGGQNARLYKLLRNKQDLGTAGWLDEDDVRVVNPHAKDRYIYLFHCASHNLKAMRNLLFASWVTKGLKEGTRKLRDTNDIPIAKQPVINCFQRDERRGAAPRSDVKRTTVEMNKWSVMNVREAKAVFSERTLVEMADHLYTSFGVKTMAGRMSRLNHELDYFSAIASHLQTLVTLYPETTIELRSEVSTFEFMAHTHEIYNGRLLKMGDVIDATNIDK